MDSAQIIGYVVLAIISLGSFVTILNKINQPINELRVVIQELKDCIKDINKENARHTNRLDKHRDQIAQLEKDVAEMKSMLKVIQHNS